MKDIMEAFKHEEGILGTVLSGAGPSLLVISHNYDVDKIKATAKDIWNNLSIKSEVKTLKVESTGAQIVE